MKKGWIIAVIIISTLLLVVLTSCSKSHVVPTPPAPTPSKNLTTLGSGFWIDQRGYVATCWHVVKDNSTSTITVQSAIDQLFDLQNGNVASANWEGFSAKVVAKDEVNDLAILKVEGTPFSTGKPAPISINGQTLAAHYKEATLKIELPNAGQKILLAGYPLGQPYLIVQEGSLASMAYSIPGLGPTAKILLSTVANPGNSGGPVIDTEGNVIGILDALLTSNLGQTGIAVAIPSYYLQNLINTINNVPPTTSAPTDTVPSLSGNAADLVQVTKNIRGEIVQIVVNSKN